MRRAEAVNAINVAISPASEVDNNLKILSLYRCPDLTSQDFDCLRGKQSLEELVIVREPEQTGPISALAALPNLKHLILFDLGPPRAVLPEDAFDWLHELRQVQKIELGGTGVRGPHITRLEEALPGVEVEYLATEPGPR